MFWVFVQCVCIKIIISGGADAFATSAVVHHGTLVGYGVFYLQDWQAGQGRQRSMKQHLEVHVELHAIILNLFSNL